MGSESTASPNLTEDKPAQQNPSGDGLEATRRETSVFVNSEPMREDQVQNAVKFLSHPKVQGSPVVYRRSFLEKKGLSKEEIDEAFRRVPDPAPTVTTTQAANPNPDGQSIATNSQPQVPTTPQPAVAPPAGVVSTMTTLRPAQFHWSHALLAIGFLTASGAGTALLFKNAVVPRLKSWIRKVVLEEESDTTAKVNSKPNLAEEAAAAAKAAAAAAADVAKASQEMLNLKNEERKYMESVMNLLGVQVEEMKSMSSAIRKLEGTKENTITPFKPPSEVKYASNVRPSSAPASVEPLAAPHPKSYMEIMAMIQRGEKPPGIKEINDTPPNPNQPPSNPQLAPRIKPWEVGQIQNGFYNAESQSTKVLDIMPTAQLNNGDTPEPWWQRKNVRITEIESEDEQKMATYRATANERLNQRSTWVPPVAPPIAMPEAAAAIRQPKSSIQKDKVIENQLTAHPSDEADELDRITKISEAGGEVDIQVSEESHVNEIQEQ